MLSYFLRFFGDIYRNRQLIIKLAFYDFKSRYLGSFIGLLWAFIQPVLTILIFLFVFEFGFKSAPLQGVPFVVWLVVGMVPWFFFSEYIIYGTNSILDNSYLVKKVVFRVGILPFVRLFSSMFVHAFFVVILFLLVLYKEISISLHAFQILYYDLCLIVLSMGLVLISSSVVLFFRDIGQIISIFVQFCFWLTPIFWSLSMIPEKYHLFIKINPVFYIINGYRDSFIYKIWFWEHPIYTLYFWSFSLFFCLFGAVIFKRLRPHFADVL